MNDTLASVEARTNSNEKAIERLADIIAKQTGVVSDLTVNVRLLQQTTHELVTREQNNGNRILSLEEYRNNLKGGWLALTVLGAFIVGSAAVVGALVATFLHRQ